MMNASDARFRSNKVIKEKFSVESLHRSVDDLIREKSDDGQFVAMLFIDERFHNKTVQTVIKSLQTSGYEARLSDNFLAINWEANEST